MLITTIMMQHVICVLYMHVYTLKAHVIAELSMQCIHERQSSVARHIANIN